MNLSGLHLRREAATSRLAIACEIRSASDTGPTKRVMPAASVHKGRWLVTAGQSPQSAGIRTDLGFSLAGRSWSDAVEAAVRTYVNSYGTLVFTREAFARAMLPTIVTETVSSGAAPHRSLARELQRLCDLQVLERIDRGVYRLRDADPFGTRQERVNGIVVAKSLLSGDDELDHLFRFIGKWLDATSRLVGNWIIYQESQSGRYHSVAKVRRIVPDPANPDMFMALIEPGTFLEFGRVVPFMSNGSLIERGLYYPVGRQRKAHSSQSVRFISSKDFQTILDFGLVNAEPELAPVSASINAVREQQAAWNVPEEQEKRLVQRSVRHAQFRAVVLSAYGSRCAISGQKILTECGQVEAEAAHIRSVEADGPDRVTNGIALSRTLHWMFDRGLIALSDEGDILVSRQSGAITAQTNLIPPDRKVRFPADPSSRPQARFLEWHRQACFKP